MPEASASTAAEAPTAGAPAHGFFQNIAGMLFSPGEEFPSIVARPRFWLPLAAWLVLGIAFTAFWLQKVDAKEFIRAQIIASGRADKMPPGQLEQQIEGGAPFFRVISWVSTIVGPPIAVLVVAGVYLFVFRFFMAGNVTYAQSLAIVTWTFFMLALVSTPLILAVMALKDDWNINPQEALQANLGMFLDKQTASKPLYKLAESLDLFTAWAIWLLATGYGVAMRRTTGAAAGGVIGVWAVYVLCKIAWAAIF